MRRKMTRMYPAVTASFSRLALVLLVFILTGDVAQSQSRSLSREPEHDLLLHVECSTGEEPCDVSRPISFTFTSELDPLQTPVVTVEPLLPGLGTQIRGNQLLVGGQPASGIGYRIRVGSGLRDTRGRPLSESDYEFTATWKLVPSLSIGNWASYVVVSPKAAQLPFVTRGISKLDAFVYAVDPSDWSRRDARPPPGRIVATETIQVTGRAEDSVRSDLDLTPAFPDGLPAHRLVIVSSGEAGLVERLWVQGTDLGVAVLPGSDDSIVWATSLRDGSSLGGVEVSDDDGTALGRTDSEGVLRVKGLAPGRLVARLGTDVAFVPPDVRSASSNTRVPCSSPRLRWAVLDAQGFAYLPGQTVHAVGRLLRANTGACGKLGSALPDSLAWKFESFRSEGRDAEQGSIPVKPSGAFEIERSIDPSLGATALVLEADVPGTVGGHWSARIVSTLAPAKRERAGELSGPRGVVVAGNSLPLTYKSVQRPGGPAGPLQWTSTLSPIRFAPPGWPEYRFGEDRFSPRYSVDPIRTQSSAVASPLRPVRNGDGTETVDANPGRLAPAFAAGLRIDVERGDFVLDRRDFIVLPSDHFVGLKLARSFLGADEALEIRGVVVDKEGKPVPGAEVMLELVRQVRRGASMSSEVAQTESARSGGDGIFQMPIAPKFADRYSVRAWVTDERGRKSLTEAILFIARRPGLAVPGEGSSSPGSDWSLASIVPARTTVSPNSEVDVLIQTPFLRGTGLLSVPALDGTRIISFRFEEGSKVLSVPVSLEALGDWPLSVEVVGPNEADYISASTGISVVQPELRVVAKTRRKFLSSRRLVDLVILDSARKPVAGAWVALAWTDGRYAKFADDEYPAPVEEGEPRYFGKDSLSLREHLVRAPYVPAPDRPGPPWIHIVTGITTFCGSKIVRAPVLPMVRDPGGLIETTTDMNGRGSALLPVVSGDGGPFRVNVLVVGSDGSVGRTILWVDATN